MIKIRNSNIEILNKYEIINSNVSNHAVCNLGFGNCLEFSISGFEFVNIF